MNKIFSVKVTEDVLPVKEQSMLTALNFNFNMMYIEEYFNNNMIVFLSVHSLYLYKTRENADGSVQCTLYEVGSMDELYRLARDNRQYTEIEDIRKIFKELNAVHQKMIGDLVQ